jgi:hypothetical protein
VHVHNSQHGCEGRGRERGRGKEGNAPSVAPLPLTSDALEREDEVLKVFKLKLQLVRVEKDMRRRENVGNRVGRGGKGPRPYTREPVEDVEDEERRVRGGTAFESRG